MTRPHRAGGAVSAERGHAHVTLRAARASPASRRPERAQAPPQAGTRQCAGAAAISDAAVKVRAWPQRPVLARRPGLAAPRLAWPFPPACRE